MVDGVEGCDAQVKAAMLPSHFDLSYEHHSMSINSSVQPSMDDSHDQYMPAALNRSDGTLISLSSHIHACMHGSHDTYMPAALS